MQIAASTKAEIASTIDVAGIATNYHDIGSGSPVVLLHGSGPGVSAWANWRLTDRIRQIGRPTFILHGRDDQVPLANSLRLLELVGQSELRVFARCGHWVQIRRATEFTKLVGDFLS